MILAGSFLRARNAPQTAAGSRLLSAVSVAYPSVRAARSFSRFLSA